MPKPLEPCRTLVHRQRVVIVTAVWSRIAAQMRCRAAEGEGRAGEGE